MAQRVRDEIEARHRDDRDAQRLRHDLGGGDADAQTSEEAGADVDRDGSELPERHVELAAQVLDRGRELLRVAAATGE